MYTLEAIGTLLVPTSVQVTPSAEREAVSEDPRRANRSQFGTVPAVPTRVVVCPGGCPLLEYQPVRRRREKGRVCGTCRQRGADHHPALGPPIGVREPRDPRRDLTIAGQPLVHELKTVRRGPDVGALAGNGDAAGLARGCGAFHRDRSNRCRRPSLWTGFYGGACENNRQGNKRARLQSPLEHTPLPGPHDAVLKKQDCEREAEGPGSTARGAQPVGCDPGSDWGVTADAVIIGRGGGWLYGSAAVSPPQPRYH